VIEVSNETFEELINKAMEELPQEYVKGLDNVVIIFEDRPSPEQREKLKLRCDHTLLGLYEGIPRTQRGMGYNLVLPDRITLFKGPITHMVDDMAELKEQIKRTLWHEIAHHYGLDHDRIHALERKHIG
jgi:predicted Zn-dependent protease with MMP-like domain